MDLTKKLAKVGQRVKAEKRIETVNEIYQILADWVVEIPIYQTQRAILMSSDRINTDTVASDITSSYSLMREIQNIEMNKE